MLIKAFKIFTSLVVGHLMSCQNGRTGFDVWQGSFNYFLYTVISYGEMSKYTVWFFTSPNATELKEVRYSKQILSRYSNNCQFFFIKLRPKVPILNTHLISLVLTCDSGLKRSLFTNETTKLRNLY